MSKLLSSFMLMFIKAYQMVISPLLPAKCRFYPTCSAYGKTAIGWHGPLRGGRLLLIRISRCHPLGGSGIDFVPIPLHRYQFYPILTNPLSVFDPVNAFPTNFLRVSHETGKRSEINYQSKSRDMKSFERSTKGRMSYCGWGVYRDKYSYRTHLNYLLNNT